MQMRYHGANDVVSEHTSEGIIYFVCCSNEVNDYTPSVLDALLYHAYFCYKRVVKLLKFKSKRQGCRFLFFKGGDVTVSYAVTNAIM